MFKLAANLGIELSRGAIGILVAPSYWGAAEWSNQVGQWARGNRNQESDEPSFVPDSCPLPLASKRETLLIRSSLASTRLLRERGVRYAFGVPGESFLGLLDALYDTPEIDLVTTRHEGGAAFMADAAAKL